MGYVRSRGLGSIPTATGGIARLACVRLDELGKDSTAILSKVGLTPAMVRDSALRIEVRSQIRLLQLAAEELKDGELGFHLARGFDLRQIGLVYYVMASSETLESAIRNAERYSQIMNDGARLRFDLKDRTATITIDYVNVDRDTDRHQIEFWLVALVRICRQVTDSRLASSLKVRHVREKIPAEFGRFFGADVEFGADCDTISFRASAASLPVTRRDDHLNKLLRSYAEEALPGKTRAPVRSKVEQVLPNLLPHGRATVTEVARGVGLSTRTLSRKLQEEGAPFTEILDQLRADLAKRYLDDKALSISAIAWLLGYREVSSLTHAFRRWTGMTPRQFRSGRPQPD